MTSAFLESLSNRETIPSPSSSPDNNTSRAELVVRSYHGRVSPVDKAVTASDSDDSTDLTDTLRTFSDGMVSGVVSYIGQRLANVFGRLTQHATRITQVEQKASELSVRMDANTKASTAIIDAFRRADGALNEVTQRVSLLGSSSEIDKDLATRLSTKVESMGLRIEDLMDGVSDAQPGVFRRLEALESKTFDSTSSSELSEVATKTAKECSQIWIAKVEGFNSTISVFNQQMISFRDAITKQTEALLNKQKMIVATEIDHIRTELQQAKADLNSRAVPVLPSMPIVDPPLSSPVNPPQWFLDAISKHDEDVMKRVGEVEAKWSEVSDRWRQDTKKECREELIQYLNEWTTRVAEEAAFTSLSVSPVTSAVAVETAETTTKVTGKRKSYNKLRDDGEDKTVPWPEEIRAQDTLPASVRKRARYQQIWYARNHPKVCPVKSNIEKKARMEDEEEGDDGEDTEDEEEDSVQQAAPVSSPVSMNDLRCEETMSSFPVAEVSRVVQ